MITHSTTTTNNKIILLPQGLSCGRGIASEVEAYYIYASSSANSPEYFAQIWGWTLNNTKEFIARIKDWHNSCNNNNLINSLYSTTNINTVGNIGGGGIKDNFNSKQHHVDSCRSELTLDLAGKTLPCQEGLDLSLHSYIISSSSCMQLLEHWVELYQGAGYPLERVLSKDLGVISSVVRKGKFEGALLILQWLYTSDDSDGRAAYLRRGNFVQPANVLNKKVFAGNLQRAEIWDKINNNNNNNNNDDDILEFDSDGYIIKQGK